jgi:hypothetical protein
MFASKLLSWHRPARSTFREAFWDGGRVWRVRFSPDEIGTWQWSTQAKPEDIGLHRQQGEFRVREYTGDNPLYRHGALRVAASGTYLEHADGTPFFWLADTAWNGVLKSQPADWQRYLATRQKQGFTAVQFVSTQWRGGNKTLKEHVFGREAKVAGISAGAGPNGCQTRPVQRPPFW